MKTSGSVSLLKTVFDSRSPSVSRDHFDLALEFKSNAQASGRGSRGPQWHGVALITHVSMI